MTNSIDKLSFKSPSTLLNIIAAPYLDNYHAVLAHSPHVEHVSQPGANLVLCTTTTAGSNEHENGRTDELRYIMNG